MVFQILGSDGRGEMGRNEGSSLLHEVMDGRAPGSDEDGRWHCSGGREERVGAREQGGAGCPVAKYPAAQRGRMTKHTFSACLQTASIMS
jgi:hypothetical protein